MKGRALRRALVSSDALRVNADVPLITTTTELITPDSAKEFLKRNAKNRPVNWTKVDEYASLMKAGRWRLHDQGIMLDTHDNVLTGQKRLWAIVRSGMNIYMRISRGNPPEAGTLIDRGTPQSARDLAARETGRAHSPTEASLARAIAVLTGNLKPSPDALAVLLETYSEAMVTAMARTRGTKKTREVLMMIGAIIHRYNQQCGSHMVALPLLVDRLRVELLPRSASECWGRGAAFSLAMERARLIVQAI